MWGARQRRVVGVRHDLSGTPASGSVAQRGDLLSVVGPARNTARGEPDDETDAAAVRRPATLGAGLGAGGGEPAVDLVDAEANDQIPPVPV